MKKILPACLFALLATMGCFAQTNSPDTSTNWGPVVYGVQMSLSVTNSELKLGSDLMLSARIKNSSTNIVSIGVVFGPVYDFKVRLLDGAGQEHDAIPKAPVRMVNGNRLMDILPGQTIETAIPIHNLNPTLKPENYTLKATRDMIVRDSRSPRETRKWQVVSNLVKVRLE